MNDWYNFYKHKQSNEYLEYIQTRYNPFISLLNSEIKHCKSIMEIGCGIGSITKLLNFSGDRFILDRNKSILEFADIKAYKILQDITNPFTTKIDLVYSHGVLEHLTDKEIKTTIREQKKVCNKLIHYVPSNKYNYKSFGDERLLCINNWKYLCEPDKVIEFNSGYDLMLIWDK